MLVQGQGEQGINQNWRLTMKVSYWILQFFIGVACVLTAFALAAHIDKRRQQLSKDPIFGTSND